MLKKDIEKILNSGKRASLAITGGGTRAISNLLQFGGGSKFLLSAHVPYTVKSWCNFCQIPMPKKLVSLKASYILAAEAYRHAIWDSEDDVEYENLLGVGLTSKLTYDGERPNREHNIYLCIRNSCGFNYYGVDFKKNRTREEQECVCSELILSCILSKCVGGRCYSPLLKSLLDKEELI